MIARAGIPGTHESRVYRRPIPDTLAWPSEGRLKGHPVVFWVPEGSLAGFFGSHGRDLGGPGGPGKAFKNVGGPALF